MAPIALRGVGHRLWVSALVVVAAVGGTGCGDDRVSSTKAVDAFNRAAEARNVRLMCPEEVDKEVKEIDCTLQGTKTGKTAGVKMRAIDSETDFIDAVDGTEFNNAVQRVTQP